MFLEFNSENFLQKNKTARVEDEFKSYLNARIATMYPEFSSPHLQLKRMYFEHQCSKSLLHALFFKPLLVITNQFIKLKKFNPSGTATNISEKEAMPTHAIAWDSLLQASKQEVEKAVTNNELGIADDDYSEYIHGKTGKIQAVETRQRLHLSSLLQKKIRILKQFVRLSLQERIESSKTQYYFDFNIRYKIEFEKEVRMLNVIVEEKPFENISD